MRAAGTGAEAGTAALVAAGGAESARIAASLAGFDQGLGAFLLAAREAEGPPPFGRLAAILQGIDLVRQEAEGLTRLLDLIARRLASDGTGEAATAATLIAALPLEAQRARLAAALATEAATAE